MTSYDIAMEIHIDASPETVYTALTTTEGVAGWWTTRNETAGVPGRVDRFWFPGMPDSWDMRVDAAEPAKLVAWHCVGGPQPWIGTDVRWTLEPTPAGTRLVFDHTGFATKEGMFRVVTLGWAQMLLRVRDYAQTGSPTPFFSQD